MPLPLFTDLARPGTFGIERATGISPESSGKFRHRVNQVVVS